jgi:hypothetical protein
VPNADFLTNEEYQFLRDAAKYLEHPRFLMRAANLVGKPVETVFRLLPPGANSAIREATHGALYRALKWSLRTLPDEPDPSATPIPRSRFSNRLIAAQGKLHTLAAATTGTVGGFFGLGGALVEIPISTMIMLRSIAHIARERGFDLDDPLTRLNCLAVFSLGSTPLEAMDSAYLTTRIGVTAAITEASRYIASHGAKEIADALSQGTAPVVLRVVEKIAARFNVTMGQKVAAQSVPVAGAAMGALVNAAFADHFNRVAEYHFGVLALEKKYGADRVQAAYQSVCREETKEESATVSRLRPEHKLPHGSDF